MFTFKQFLSEMPRLFDYFPGPSFEISRHPHAKYIGSRGDHDIHAHSEDDRATSYTVHPKGSKPYNGDGLKIRTQEINGIKHIKGLRKSPSYEGPKAHEIYADLIVRHGLKIGSDSGQSHGGQHTWRSLLDYPDIQVHTDKGEEVDHSNFDKFYTNTHKNTSFVASKRNK